MFQHVWHAYKAYKHVCTQLQTTTSSILPSPIDVHAHPCHRLARPPPPILRAPALPPWAPAPQATCGTKMCTGMDRLEERQGKRMGLETRLVSSPWYTFFLFFFDYTNTYIHLEVQLRDPIFYIYMHPSTRPRQHGHIIHTNSLREKAQTMQDASFGPYVSFFFYIRLFFIC